MYDNSTPIGGKISSNLRNLVRVSKANPCPHCEKSDWCYAIGELSVCSRDIEPATGWEATSKTDKEGHVFYARPQEKKPARPKQTRYFPYPARDGSQLVRAVRVDDGEGKKKIWQEHWDGSKWQKGLGDVARASIPVYRYQEVQKAKAAGQLIFTVDGEQCADKFWDLGLAATTSFGGMGKFSLTDSLDLQDAAGIVIAPDRDQPGIKDAEKVAQHFLEALWLYCYPESKAWENPQKSQGLDVFDWIQDKKLSADDIKVAIGDKKVFNAPTSQAASNVVTHERFVARDDTQTAQCKNGQLLQLIETHWGNRLRFNEMSQQIEIDGTGDFDIGLIYLRIAEELGRDIAKQAASDLVQVIALKNTYSPVRDYLNSLTNIKPIDLDSLAKRYFGTDDPLHAKFFKNTLIAAVARAFEPGCQVDTTCILQGDQGLFKSRLWQTLASDPWFTDNLSEASEKDEKMKLRHSWILEYSEFETVYKRKEVSQLKSFLTSRIDTFRRPYGRSIEKFPRTSVFVGTTNRQEFLSDSTGERRFLVIPVSQPIPIKIVQEERDAIWAAAVEAYRNGQQWWLTSEEDKLLAEANKSWQSTDTWETSILSHLDNKSETTIADILTTVIRLDLAEHKKSEQMRVSDILRCNGWIKARNPKRIDGKLQKYWERVVTGGNGVVTKVVTPQNSYPDSVLSIPLPPVTTFLSKDSSSLPSSADETSKTSNDETSKTSNSESEESFETKVVTPPPDNSQNLLEQAFQPVTTPLLPPPLIPVSSAKIGAKHKTFEEGDRVVIVEIGSLHEGQRGEIIHVAYGSRDIDYTVKLDKESHGNQRVRVTVPKDSKSTYLMKL